MRNLLVHWSKGNVNEETRLSMKWNTLTSCRNRIHKSLSLLPEKESFCFASYLLLFSMFILILNTKVKTDKSSVFLLLISDFSCLRTSWACSRNLQNLKVALEKPIAASPFFQSHSCILTHGSGCRYCHIQFGKWHHTPTLQ